MSMSAATAALLAAGLIIATGLATPCRGPPTGSLGRSPRTSRTLSHTAAAPGASPRLDLSHGDRYDADRMLNGRLLLSGGLDPLIVSGAAAAPNATRQLCRVALVDPATLALSGERTGNCEDPRLYGLRALPINVYDQRQHRTAQPSGSPAAAGRRLHVGPVVMRYTELSDTDAEWVYGDGSLWIYDNLTTRGSILLRVS